MTVGAASTGGIPAPGRVAVVAAGGGARGAYEAGVLSEVVPELVAAGARPSVFLGTSAGSINAVLLASMADRLGSVAGARAAMEDLAAVWTGMTCGLVFRPLLAGAWTTATGVLAELARLPRPRLTGLLDTRPLEGTSAAVVDWERLHANVRSGAVAAVAVTATAADGWTRVFLEAAPDVPVPPPDDARALDYCPTPLGPSHLRASCALPLLFTPVAVEQPPEARGWYLDGGVRLNAPLKPAIALGADALVVVTAHPPEHAPRPAPGAITEPPEVDDVLSQVLDSLMADRMIEDLLTLGKVNALVAAGGPPRLDGDVQRPYREVRHLVVGPTGSGVLGALARQAYAARFGGAHGMLAALRQPDLPLLRRFLGGDDGPRAGDLLSYLFFDGAFAEAALETGRRDARRRLDEARQGSGDALPWAVNP